MNETQVLIEEIRKLRSALAKIESFYDRTLASDDFAERSQECAIVIADLLAKYYTCLETLFLRVSQFFENNLYRRRWHADLLDKMTLEIPGLRNAVVADSTKANLLELLKFRHFTRYYFDIAYDWDRLLFLTKKMDDLRSPLADDLDQFLLFLNQL
jgi:hypothetical protein